MGHSQLGLWLLQSTLCGAIILSLGCLAVFRCRQPIFRIRIIHWTFLACLIVPVIRHWELLPTLRMGLWSHVPMSVAAPATGAELVEWSPNVGSDVSHSVGSKHPAFPRTFVASDPNIPMVPDPATGEPLRTAHEGAGWEAIVGGLISACVLLYCLAVTVMMGFWSVGYLMRRRIARTAVPADEALYAVLKSIAGEDRCQRVRLLVSDRISSPVMWGLWRPTIVVPVQLAAAPQSAALRYGLAHEWSHVRHRDFFVFTFANLAKLLCFYQPAYWWLRKQLLLSQDYLADAFAANHGASAEDYATFLVSLARMRAEPRLAATLGISDRRSNLLQRVQILVQATRPLLQEIPRIPAIIMTIVVVFGIGGLGAVRLNAEASADQPEPAAENKTPPPEAGKSEGEVQPEAKPRNGSVKEQPQPITYTGKVIDRITKQPIAGAVVQVFLSLNRDPVTRKIKTLETTEHPTDESGEYSFTLTSEQVAQSSLYIEVQAHHSDYQQSVRAGYAHSMILKNQKNGEPPFYSTLKLSPGQPVSAVVLQPDGAPAANVQVQAYTKAPSAKTGLDFELGTWQFSQTDGNGRLRLVVATPGDGVIWVYPQDFSPLAYRIGDGRGEIEPLKLKDGTRLTGQVLDAQGKPIPNVAVNLQRNGDGEAPDEFLNANAVANGIRAGAMTDAEGQFQLRPLPAGRYRAKVSGGLDDPTQRRDWRSEGMPLNHVFIPLNLEIRDGEPSAPLEFRAVPHVLVRGRFFNSEGKPSASHEQFLFGQTNGQNMFVQSSVPGNDGWFEFMVPRGIENVKLDFMTNEHSALRWRLKPDEPLQYGNRATLGTLDEDFTTLEVVRYTAPILLLKAVDEAGDQIKGLVPESKYMTRPAEERGGKFISGALGDIGFESQPDGRWRSSQLLPDEEVTITLKKEGYTCEPQTVSLKEKETRELVFVMNSKATEKTETDAAK